MIEQAIDPLCITCEREQAHTTTLRRARQMEQLLAITWTINGASTEQELVRGVTRQAAEVCSAQLATIGVIEGASFHFSLLDQAGAWQEVSYPINSPSIVGWVVRTKQPYRTNDLASDPHSDHTFDTEAGYRQQLCVPLLGSDGTVLGVLSMYNTTDGSDFTAEDEHTLMTVAAQTAIALERARVITERTAALESVRRSEHNYRMLMEQAADGVFINYPGGPFLDVNEQACAMFGYTREELIGRYPHDVILPANLEATPLRMDEVALGHTVMTERVIVRKDGSRFAAEVNARRLEDGRVLAQVRDVSERRRVEDEVRFQASLLAAVGQAVTAITPTGTFTYWNRAAETMFGWTAAEAAGRTAIDLNMLTGSSDDVAGQFGRALSDQPVAAEIVLRRRDGTVFPAWASTSVLRDAESNVAQIIVVMADISDQKAAQNALRASEERFRSLVQNASDVIVVLGADGRVSYASPSVRHVLGYDPEGEIGTDPFGRVHPDDRARIMASFASVVGRPGPYPPTEMRIQHADGNWRTFEATATNLLHDPAVRGVVENLRDITERKRAEASIHFQARLLDAVRQSIVATDLTGRVIYWNDAATELYGWGREEAMGQSLRSLIVPAEYGESGAAIIADLARGIPWSGEFPLRHRDGRPLTVWVNNAPLLDEQGRFAAIIGISQDISERKAAERAIRHLAAIVEGSDDAILSATIDGTIISWNAGAERIFGYHAEEMYGRNIAMLAPPDLAGECRGVLERIARGEPVLHVESRRLRKDGALIDVAITASALRNGDSSLLGVSIIARDVTEQRRLAERLAAAERLSAIGELAAGVAHEVNNPLAAIALHAELALRQPLTEQAGEDIRTIFREAQRAGDIVRALLRFARQREPEMGEIPVTTAIDEALLLSQERLERHHITVVQHFKRTPHVRADRDQLVQVFLNLINNAIDAMKDQGSGTLTIHVRRIGASIDVRVTDSGPGIAPAAFARIFDPFFTTKSAGEGTGLGLSLSASIIARHQGELSAESGGPGACFRVTLPATKRGGARRSRSSRRARTAPVLVLLDDPLAAAALTEAIRVLGHEAEALSPSAVPEQPARVRAILVDSSSDEAIISAWRRQAPGARLIAVGDTPADGCETALPDRYRLADLEALLGQPQ